MQNKMTASCSNGKIAIEHDNRVRNSKNIDPALSINNEYLIKCESLRQAYHGIFDEVVDRYNNKQKRKDRKIADYYDKISKSKNGEKLAYEYVLQIGSRDTNPTNGEYQEVSKEIYKEWLNEFMSCNTNLIVINAAIHCDEPNGTPHMHITVVPVAHYAKGMEIRNSLSGAMREMGYKEPADWCLDVQKQLGNKLVEKGLEYVQLGTHREHIENGLYQELKEKALTKIEAEMESSHVEIARMSQIKDELIDNVSELETQVETLSEEIAEKQGIIYRLENKVMEWIGKFKSTVKALSGEILSANMKDRIEKVLRDMPGSFVNEFKERWNSFDDELPCFTLQYEAPEKKNIYDSCFEVWKKYYSEGSPFYATLDQIEERLRALGFSNKEIHSIVVTMRLGFPSLEDFEKSMELAYRIALDNHKNRVLAKPVDLKEKYLHTEKAGRKLKKVDPSRG